MLLPRFDFYLLLKFKVALGGGLLGGGNSFHFFFFNFFLFPFLLGGGCGSIRCFRLFLFLRNYC